MRLTCNVLRVRTALLSSCQCIQTVCNWCVSMLHNVKMYKLQLTLLWRIEARLQAVEKLIKAQFPIGVLIRELNEGINTQAPVKHTHSCTEHYRKKHTVETITLGFFMPPSTGVHASVGSHQRPSVKFAQAQIGPETA